jgi:Tol biopolymer transport system component
VHNAIVFGEAMTGAESPVDIATLKPQGSPVPVVDDVASLPSSGAGQFDFSKNGLFVYKSGKASPDMWSMVGWNGTTGVNEFGPNSAKSQLQISKPAPYFTPRFSPDGKRLALGIETKGLDIYLYDFQSDVLTRLTFTGQLSYNPVWTPDGKHIVFQTVSGNDHALMWIRIDGAGGSQKLLEGKSLLVPRSFSPDGKYLAYHSGLQNRSDLWVLPLDITNPDQPKPGKAEVLVGTPANEKQPAISPDGRWIAYSSDESGIDEIYVRPFHGASDGKWQISSGGGNIPGWSRDGKNLFFENMDGRIMVAGYEGKGDSFAASKPRVWSDRQLVAPTGDPNFDISPDGKTIVALVRSSLPGDAAESVKATFLLNFFDELRRRTGSAGH